VANKYLEKIASAEMVGHISDHINSSVGDFNKSYKGDSSTEEGYNKYATSLASHIKKRKGFYSGFEGKEPELDKVLHSELGLMEKLAANFRVPKGFGANLNKARMATASGAKSIGKKSDEFMNESKKIHDQKFGKNSPGLNKAPSKDSSAIPKTKAFNSNLKNIRYGVAGVAGAGIIGNGIYQNVKQR